jgi:hypothetical protein
MTLCDAASHTNFGSCLAVARWLYNVPHFLVVTIDARAGPISEPCKAG